MESLITIVIPTTAEKARFNQIKRAIKSIRNASRFYTKIIVVVNGDRKDEDVVNWLSSNEDITVIKVELGSAPNAQYIGRTILQTEYFAFLDDDDCFMAGALDKRLNLLLENPDAALVVTNGYSEKNGEQSPHYTGLNKIQNEPLKYLFKMNWLHNCNHLMRSAFVVESYFKNYHNYFEWTWLAYKIAINKLKVISSDDLTFIYYDTPGSVSKSMRYYNSLPALVEKMLDMNPPDEIKLEIRYKLSSHYHDMADNYLKEDKMMKSFENHLKSIFSYKGYRYLPFTRHILLNFFFKYKNRCNKGVKS